MIVRIDLRGSRAFVFAEDRSLLLVDSAERFRCRFRERGDAVGLFEAEIAVLGANDKVEDPSIQPITAEVLEIKERLR